MWLCPNVPGFVQGGQSPLRSAAGYAFGFNGSAGVWRRAAIEDPAVGGWSADTLCEDLDLAYRAQLAGWRGAFVDQVAAPAEVPRRVLAWIIGRHGSVESYVRWLGVSDDAVGEIRRRLRGDLEHATPATAVA